MWKSYERKPTFDTLRPYVPGENMTGISISDVDRWDGSPKVGDMIARNEQNPKDQWLVAKAYFEEHYWTK